MIFSVSPLLRRAFMAWTLLPAWVNFLVAKWNWRCIAQTSPSRSKTLFRSAVWQWKIGDGYQEQASWMRAIFRAASRMCIFIKTPLLTITVRSLLVYYSQLSDHQRYSTAPNRGHVGGSWLHPQRLITTNGTIGTKNLNFIEKYMFF